jgi:hypothetical protein
LKKSCEQKQVANMAVPQRARQLLRAGAYGVCEWVCEEHSERNFSQYLSPCPHVTAEGYLCVFAAYLFDDAKPQRTRKRGKQLSVSELGWHHELIVPLFGTMSSFVFSLNFLKKGVTGHVPET